jgi:hypothetical protein
MNNVVSSQRLPRMPALDLRPVGVVFVVDNTQPGEAFLRVTGFSPTSVIPMVHIHTQAYAFIYHRRDDRRN